MRKGGGHQNGGHRHGNNSGNEKGVKGGRGLELHTPNCLPENICVHEEGRVTLLQRHWADAIRPQGSKLPRQEETSQPQAPDSSSR